MNARNLIVVRGIVALLLVWGVVFAVVKIAGAKKPTIERLVAYQEENPLEEMEDPEERKQVITRVAEMLNAMEAEEVAKLAEQEEDDPRRNFFGELNGEEKIFFLEQRIGRAFQQMMQTFNEMDREERKQMVDRALSRIRSEEGVGRDGQNRFEEADPEIAERIAEAGLQSYLSDASAETKIDLAPLMEELQSVMGGMGGRPR